jgi:hypothetical protein
VAFYAALAFAVVRERLAKGSFGEFANMTLNLDTLASRESAIAKHRQLQQMDASPLDLGHFYVRCLELRVWSTQTSLSKDMAVSATRVSRCISATKLPEEVLRVLRDTGSVSYKSLAKVMYIVNRTGVHTARERARRIPKGSNFNEIEAILLGAAARQPSATELKVTLGPQNKYLRIHSAQIDKIIPRMQEFQAMLSALMTHMVG